MATDIDMCSNALLLIGDEPISAFTDPGAGATVAGNIYEETYKAFLAEHPWTFALKEQTLNLLSQTPDDLTHYSRAHQVPPSAIRIWAIFPVVSYAIVGQVIYSNEQELLCRFVHKVEESQLPAHAVKAMEYKLASEFAASVTESDSKSEFMLQKYKDQLAKAKNIDSQGKTQVPIVRSPFISARKGGRSTYFGWGW